MFVTDVRGNEIVSWA